MEYPTTVLIVALVSVMIADLAYLTLLQLQESKELKRLLKKEQTESARSLEDLMTFLAESHQIFLRYRGPEKVCLNILIACAVLTAIVAFLGK